MAADWYMYIFLIALVLMSAFFSSSETAFSSLNRIRIRNYADEGNKKAKIALKIADNYDRAISTILVGNNIVNISAASLATVLFTKLVGAEMGPALSTVVMTVIILIFGEIMPKSFAKVNSEKVALGFAWVLHFLMIVFKPIVSIFVAMTNGMNKRISTEDETPSVTEQELKYIIESIEEEGVLEQEESDLVQSALDFDDITVQEILTPRVDMVAIDVDDPPDEIIAMLISEGFSRIPVYEKTIDKIIGIVRSKDVLICAVKGEPIHIRHMVTDCMFIHKTMKISQLLAHFKHDKVHVAIVTDDYGGTMGLVSLEDVLEQLVGEIWDEYDEEEKYFEKIEDNTYEVAGDLNIYEMLEFLEYDDKQFDSDYNTVGGWVLEMFEHIPELGESFRFENMLVTVLELDDQRIKKIRIEMIQEEASQQE